MSLDSQPSTSSSLQDSNPCRRFEFWEIQLATNDFDEALIIGHGGFGKVYKASVFDGSTQVIAAIKRLDSMSNQGADEFWAEIDLLSKLRHYNVVSFMGYCNYEREMILVYEYMPNGTLADHLHKLGTRLSWIERLKICVGAACGLHYLHNGTGNEVGVIHRDVKSPNILLDKNWTAKISDFGLSKIGQLNQTASYFKTIVKGTFGYLDPDYYATGKLTRKSDVYAFGVVLLEVLCRKRAVDSSLDEEQWNLAKWAEESIKEGKLKSIIDPDIRDEISAKCLKMFIRIVQRCLHNSRKQRSTMAEVVANLDSVLTLQQEKYRNSSRPVSKSIFSRMVDVIHFPSNKENYVEEDLKIDWTLLKRFSLRELQVATDNFDNRNILHQSGFGKVYKGRIADGTLVAVKRMKEERTQSLELQFHTEVSMIGMVEHRNLLQLQGCCMTQTERLLVYPYMANGSVASCLRDRSSTQVALDWPIRKRIALGSARGLAYLHDHCNPKIIHRDVKAANILLDEDFEAVVSDFGLAKLMDSNDTHVTTAIRGTIGHIAPEYLSTGKTSERTDIFGYGVMLLELVTGKRAFDLARLANDDNVMLLDWVKGLLQHKKLETLVDVNLEASYVDDEVEELIQIALLCTQMTPTERPKMSEVVRMLEGDGLVERWEEWQKEEFLRRDFNQTHNPNIDWIVDSDDSTNYKIEELSGPR